MQPLIPPPSGDTGATTFPRTLQKWLDCNPITPLTRTQAFLTIPAFNVIGINWQGYSDIVASYNFEGPNNFSLSGLSQMPVSPNYLMAISWRDNNGHIFRYCLWKNVGEVFLFPVPLYTGQAIMKNFRIEIWSTGVTASQSTNIQLYTSVLGGVDYRWGNDFSLVNADTINLNFAISVEAMIGLTPQLIPSAGVVLGGWLRADTGISGENWALKNNGSSSYFSGNFTASSNITTTTESGIKNQIAVTGLLPIACNTPNGLVPNDIWLMFQYNGDGVILDIFNVTKLSINSGILSIDTNALGNTPLAIGGWYIVEWWYNTGLGQCNIWTISSNLTVENYISNINTNVRSGGSILSIGNVGAGSASVVVTDLIVYSGTLTSSDQQINLNYFSDRYQSIFALPFVWPTGSYSVVNTPQFILLENNNIINTNNLISWASGSGNVIGAG